MMRKKAKTKSGKQKLVIYFRMVLKHTISRNKKKK